MCTSSVITRDECQLEKKHLRYLFHEMNNNFSAISLTLEDLKMKFDARPDCEEEVAELQAALQTISRTSEAMQELLRSERQACTSHELATEVVDLCHLLREVMRRFTSEAARKGVKLALDVPTHATVTSSYHLIGLILENLVGNAVKYSAHGTVTLRAQEHLEGSQLQWLVSVSDEGSGIPEDQLLKLFNTVEHRSKHSTKGFGIGLAIAVDAAKLLGAQLRATSQVGVGSIIYLLLHDSSPKNDTHRNHSTT